MQHISDLLPAVITPEHEPLLRTQERLAVILLHIELNGGDLT